MSVDVALIVIAAVVPCVLLFFNVLIMAKYLDAEATRGHYIAKVFTLLGMLLAECTILLLPLDVGNRTGLVGCGFWNNGCGGLNLAAVWQIVYWIIFGLLVVVFPYMIFFYEADDEGLAAEDAARAAGTSTCMARLCDFRGCGRATVSAVIYTLITIVIAGVVIALMYTFLNTTEIPYKLTSVDVQTVAFMPLTVPIQTSCAVGTCLQPCGTGTCNWVTVTLNISVTFVIYVAALMSFVGWFIFTIYVGIGFIALPIDCINAFKFRPRPLAHSELQKQRKALKDRAAELMKVAYDMGNRQVTFNEEVHSGSEKRKAKRSNAQEMNRYRVLVDLLESDLEKFQMSDPQYYRQHYNPFVPWFKLFFGIISIIITIVWLLQIIIYMLFNPPLYPFLVRYSDRYSSLVVSVIAVHCASHQLSFPS
jgi:LMBR1 domain-containing protein 1